MTVGASNSFGFAVGLHDSSARLLHADKVEQRGGCQNSLMQLGGRAKCPDVSAVSVCFAPATGYSC